MRPDQRAAFGVSAAHTQLVGSVVIEWSRLESVLDYLIWDFLDISFEDGRVLTGRADAGTKIAHLRSIASRHLANHDKLEGLLVALDALDACREDRNFIVHGSWGTLHPEDVPIAASIRSKSKPDEVTNETFPAQRMHGLISVIVEMRVMLYTLLDELEAAPDTLLK
jgi:hypothetical protein